MHIFEFALSNHLPPSPNTLTPDALAFQALGRAYLPPRDGVRHTQGCRQTRFIRKTDPCDKQASQRTGLSTYGKQLSQRSQIGGLQAGRGPWTCFVWPIQCSKNILISCQSHEISHKNVDFWLLLKNRKSGSTGRDSHLTTTGPAESQMRLETSISQSPLLPGVPHLAPPPIYNTRLPT